MTGRSPNDYAALGTPWRCAARNRLGRHAAEWDDADRATYLAEDIEINGIESAMSAFDPWEAAIYVRALRMFAAVERERTNGHSLR